MMITIASLLIFDNLALFDPLLLYFSPRIILAFRYDAGWSKGHRRFPGIRFLRVNDFRNGSSKKPSCLRVGRQVFAFSD